jgi:hypothetical protein
LTPLEIAIQSRDLFKTKIDSGEWDSEKVKLALERYEEIVKMLESKSLE